MIIRGHASTATLDRVKSIIAPGAFAASIAARGVKQIDLLWDHDKSRPIGRVLWIETRESGLWVEAQLDSSFHGVSKIIDQIRSKREFGFSVGGKLRRYMRKADGTLLVRTAELYEISVTDDPANPDCVLSFEPEKRKLWPDDLAAVFDKHDKTAPNRSRKQDIRYENTQ